MEQQFHVQHFFRIWSTWISFNLIGLKLVVLILHSNNLLNHTGTLYRHQFCCILLTQTDWVLGINIFLFNDDLELSKAGLDWSDETSAS